MRARLFQSLRGILGLHAQNQNGRLGGGFGIFRNNFDRGGIAEALEQIGLRAGGDDIRGLANIGPEHSLNDGRGHAACAEKRIFHDRKASGEKGICKDCREWEAGLLGGLTTEDTERTEGEGDWNSGDEICGLEVEN